MDNQDEEDSKRYKPGELLSCDNVGPISPKSFEGYTQAFVWRDTYTKSSSRVSATNIHSSLSLLVSLSTIFIFQIDCLSLFLKVSLKTLSNKSSTFCSNEAAKEAAI